MKLLDVLFCDDVRFEAKNKLSVMGLYNDRMVYPKVVKWPVTSRMAVLMRFSVDEHEKLPRSFEFRCFHKEKNVVEVKGEIQPNSSQSVVCLVVSAEGVQLDVGELGYEISMYDEGKEVILNKKNKCALKVMME